MTAPDNHNGFSLIEVLISLLLISLILFGFEAGQLYAMRETQLMRLLSTAMNQMNNAEERLIALKKASGLQEQIMAWNAENERNLPSGFGTVSGMWPRYRVTVYWGNKSHHCANNTAGISGCITKNIQLG